MHGPFFFYFKDSNKIYGPSQVVSSGRMKSVTFLNRRGIVVSTPFYINIPGAGHVQLSEIQSQMLLNELEYNNRSHSGMDVIFLSFQNLQIHVRLLRQSPLVSVSDFSWKINLKEIRDASARIHAELKQICREKVEELKLERLLRLRSFGRDLFSLLFKDGYFIDYFSGLRNGNLAVHLSPDLFFIPFEHMAIKELFLLEFRITRLLDHKPGWKLDLQPERRGMLFMYDRSEKVFVGESQKLLEQWGGSARFESSAVSMQATPESRLKDLYKRSRFVHYIGHSTINNSRYKWLNGKNKPFLPAESPAPEFIFADSCHDHFYTGSFHKTLSLFFRQGLRFWISGMAEIRVHGDFFPSHFYENLFRTGSFGHALLQTRRQMADAGKSSFLQYISAGDQNFSFRKELFLRGSC